MLKAIDWLLSLSKEDTILRPPGAITEKDFLQKCIRCNKCVQICPHDSIKIAKIGCGFKIGSPVIYPREVPCYVCMKCPPYLSDRCS